ncbi:MAG: EpsI family protein [Planctomycetes bacterium]|nr:EpsI family protein [Planctomycetota bacterium]
MTGKVPSGSGAGWGSVASWRVCAVVTVVLLLGGASYRLAMARLRPLMTARIELPVPLAEFPEKIGRWQGKERPLSAAVERIAGNDDYLNRLYINSAAGERANLYVAYSARPRNMLGHRPRTCYVGAGWVHDRTDETEVALVDGGDLACLVHRFHLPPPKSGQVVVLNYYILNGVTTNDASSFTGVGWRLPNISGNPAWYVAQVQISSSSEAAVRRLAAATARRIFDFLPDSDGKVREVEARAKMQAGEHSTAAQK